MLTVWSAEAALRFAIRPVIGCLVLGVFCLSEGAPTWIHYNGLCAVLQQRKYIYIYMYTYVHIHMCVCIYMHVCVYIHTWFWGCLGLGGTPVRCDTHLGFFGVQKGLGSQYSMFVRVSMVVKVNGASFLI